MKLNYEEFKEELIRRLEEIYNGEKEVMLNKVIKNNLGEVEALVIRGNDNISPNFYIQELYKGYMNSESDISEIVNIMVDKCNSVYEEKKRFDVQGIDVYENVKDKIVYRIINTDMNTELLKETPHIKWLDLSIVFYILVKMDENGTGSVRITNSLMDTWNVQIDDLSKAAYENTQKLMPAKIRSLMDIVSGIVFDEGKNTYTNIEQAWKNNYNNGVPIVISNNYGINGFSTVLYEGFLKKIADELGAKEFYILPSSIHEGIIVYKGVGRKDVSELKKMVKEVNETVVERFERLSDTVYLYNRETDKVSIAS